MFKNHPKGLLQAALSNMGDGNYIIVVLTLFLRMFKTILRVFYRPP